MVDSQSFGTSKKRRCWHFTLWQPSIYWLVEGHDRKNKKLVFIISKGQRIAETSERAKMQKRQKRRKKKTRKKERERERRNRRRRRNGDGSSWSASISLWLRSFNNGCKGKKKKLFEGVPNFSLRVNK